MNAREKAHHDKPFLYQELFELCRLVDAFLTKCNTVKIKGQDDFAFMGLCFLNRQIKQSEVILKLIDKGYDMDAQLINRSQMEGLVFFLWTANDRSKRALRWRTFGYIEEWRSIQRKIKIKKQYNKKRLTYLKRKLSEYGNIHLKKKAKSKAGIKDPYARYWYGELKIFDIMKDLDGEQLYDVIYRRYSAWHHWNPLPFEEVLISKDDKIYYSHSSDPTSATILAHGFQCLWRTTQIVNNHLNLNFDKKLNDINSEFISWHKRTE
ncbi:MAG: DUF5677 domain-containing protein [bacterium]